MRRLATALLTLLAASAVIFTVMRLVPGDPITTLLSSADLSDPGLVAKVRAANGLDEPVVVQYFVWLRNIFAGDLGRSLVSSDSVATLLGRSVGPSLLLGLAAAALGIPVGIAWGMAASHLPRWLSAPLRSGTLIVAVLPSFSVGLVLVYLVAVRLDVLPAAGLHAPTGGGTGDLLAHLILPAVTLSLVPAALVARLTYASVEDIEREDFVRTAASFGLRKRRVAFAHTLPNVLLPIITIGGLLTSSIITNAVLVEEVFAWPGVGSLMVNAVRSRDYPVVQAGALVLSATYVAFSWIADMLYLVADPRVRNSRGVRS